MKITGTGPPETFSHESHPQKDRFTCIFCNGKTNSINDFYYHIMVECPGASSSRKVYIEISRKIITHFFGFLTKIRNLQSNENLLNQLIIFYQNILGEIGHLRENLDIYDLIRFFLDRFDSFLKIDLGMIKEKDHSGYAIPYKDRFKFIIACRSTPQRGVYSFIPSSFSYPTIFTQSCNNCKNFIDFYLDLDTYREKINKILKKILKNLHAEIKFLEIIAQAEKERAEEERAEEVESKDVYTTFIRKFYIPLKNKLISIGKEIVKNQKSDEPLSFLLEIFQFLEEIKENFEKETEKNIQIYICLDCSRFYVYIENIDENIEGKNYLLEFLGNREWIENFKIKQPPSKCNICQKRILRIY